MKEIVVIFVKTREVHLSEGRLPDDDKTNRTDKSTIDNESAPPFWTWFIENPRPRSSRYFSSLAGLTLAT
jgi:hypothetical protein